MTSVESKKLAGFFKALGHPTRVAIVKGLLEEGRCVSNLEDMVQVSQPNMSQHLAILKAGEVVDWKQDGKKRCYFLKEPRLLKRIIREFAKTAGSR